MKNSPVAAVAVSVSLLATMSVAAQAQSLPAVKTGSANAVPECATPGRMMAFLAERNPKLDPRFAGIATAYMRHGEELGVRWDYAFFQMILETGGLAYKRGNGKPGDVKPSQNNFAGLGATGGGEPGETFATIEDGVKAHLQHLLMYSGERVEAPVAERTRKVQEWGVLTSWQKGFKRPITFADVAGKWAPGSRGYVSDVKSIGGDFFDDHCKKADPKPELVQEARKGRAGGPQTARAEPAKPQGERGRGTELARQAIERARDEGDATRSGLGAKAAAAAGPSLKVLNEPKDEPAAAATPADATTAKAAAQPASAAGAAKPSAGKAGGNTVTAAAVPPKAPPAATAQPAPPSTKCRVWTASYGGQRAVIIRSSSDQFTNFTVLDVNEGQEVREVEAYISTYAKGGEKIADFSSQNTALDRAFQLCPEG